MKLVKPGDWAMLQVSGALVDGARDSRLPRERLFARLGSRLFEIQTRQSEPLAIALSPVPPKRNERPTSGDARRRQSRTVRRLSCEGVCKLRQPDLHDLSYERADGRRKAVPAAFEFRYAVRSCASPEHRSFELRELS